MDFLHKLKSATSERSLHLTRRAWVSMTLLALALFSPFSARADYTGSGAGGGVTPLESSDIGTSLLGFAESVAGFLTGPFGLAAATVILLFCVIKAMTNMQRQQSAGGPMKVAGFTILFFLVPILVDWAGQTSGAVM